MIKHQLYWKAIQSTINSYYKFCSEKAFRTYLELRWEKSTCFPFKVVVLNIIKKASSLYINLGYCVFSSIHQLSTRPISLNLCRIFPSFDASVYNWTSHYNNTIIDCNGSQTIRYGLPTDASKLSRKADIVSLLFNLLIRTYQNLSEWLLWCYLACYPITLPIKSLFST